MTQILLSHPWQRLLNGEAHLPFGSTTARDFAVDIHDNDSEYRIVAELPGVDKEQVSVQVENNVLHIRTLAKKATDNAGKNGSKNASKNQPSHDNDNLLLSERVVGEKSRAFRLSRRVDAENIHATLANGVLTIIVPKAADAVSRNISIN